MNKILLFLLSAAVVLCAQDKIYASFDVAAAKDAQLALKAVGIVKTVNVEIGSAVKRGDVLLELENDSEKLAVKLAQNDLESAQTAKAHTKSVLDKFKLVQSVSSKQAFENAEFDFKNAALAENRAHLALNLAQKRLEDTRLLAPFDGTISGKSIEVGEGVGGVAQKLMSIFSYPDVKLKLSFDEKFKDRVKIGSKFIYKLDGQSEERRGEISLIYPTIDTKNGKIYAEVQAQNLTPGLFGEGYIVSSVQDGDATSDKKAAEPKNKDKNKTSELKFEGLKNGGHAASGAKFGDKKTSFGAARFLNLRAQTKSEINLNSNSAYGVKFDYAAKNANLTSMLNLSHKQGSANLNAEFGSAQILLAAKRQTLFAGQGGSKKSEFVATGVKFDGKTAMRSANLRAQVGNLRSNLSLNSANGVKFDALNFSFGRYGANLNDSPNLLQNASFYSNLSQKLNFATKKLERILPLSLNLGKNLNPLLASNLIKTPNLAAKKANLFLPQSSILIKNQAVRLASNLPQNPNLAPKTAAKKTEPKDV